MCFIFSKICCILSINVNTSKMFSNSIRRSAICVQNWVYFWYDSKARFTLITDINEPNRSIEIRLVYCTLICLYPPLFSSYHALYRLVRAENDVKAHLIDLGINNCMLSMALVHSECYIDHPLSLCYWLFSFLEKSYSKSAKRYSHSIKSSV